MHLNMIINLTIFSTFLFLHRSQILLSPYILRDRFPWFNWFPILLPTFLIFTIFRRWRLWFSLAAAHFLALSRLLVIIRLLFLAFATSTLAWIQQLNRHNDLALSNLIIMILLLLHDDLRPLFDFTFFFPLYGVVNHFLAASLEYLLLQNRGLICFTIVPPIIELIVTGFHHWDHATPSHEADAQNKAKWYPKWNDIVRRHTVARIVLAEWLDLSRFASYLESFWLVYRFYLGQNHVCLLSWGF